MPTLTTFPTTEVEIGVGEDDVFEYPEPYDPQTLLSADQQGAAPYNRYTILTRYQHHTGLESVPVAGPVGTPAQAVRLHGGYCKKTVAWVAERLGAPPVLPHWNPSPPNSNELLQYKEITPEAPTLLPGGSAYAWRVRGVYVYLLLVAPGDNDPLWAGTTAVVTTPAGLNQVTPAQFDRTLLGSQAPTGQ